MFDDTCIHNTIHVSTSSNLVDGSGGYPHWRVRWNVCTSKEWVLHANGRPDFMASMECGLSTNAPPLILNLKMPLLPRLLELAKRHACAMFKWALDRTSSVQVLLRHRPRCQQCFDFIIVNECIGFECTRVSFSVSIPLRLPNAADIKWISLSTCCWKKML